MRENKTLTLFKTFFKIGLFTFGGGYAMIPLIQNEVVNNHKWLKDEDILDIIAIAESTPGPIAINSATFVGYKVAGFWGALFATLGVVLPSFIIIFALSFILQKFEDNKYVQYAFTGIRAAVLFLVGKALISMYRQCPKNIFSYAVMIIAFVLSYILDVNVLIIIVLAAVAGLTYSLLTAKKEVNR